MAVGTLSNQANSLKRVFHDERLDYHLNAAAEFFMELQKVKKAKPLGRSYEWPSWLQMAVNTTNSAEGGSIGTFEPGTYDTSSINAGQFVDHFDVSWLLEASGEGEGAYDKSTVKRMSWECMTATTKHVNRIFAGTYGTGNLGQIQTTATATTFTLKLPFGVLKVRPGMTIDVYTAETGGSQEIDSIKITKVAFATRVITLASSQTATADSFVYIEDTRTNSTVPNGIDGLVDDGTNLTTVHGLSRSTYDELKSIVLGNGGTLRDLSEDLLVRGAHLTYQKSGQFIDCLLMNTGQEESYLRFVRPDRRRNFDGTGAVGHDTGYPEKLTFVYGGRKCPIYVSSDVKPRTVYGLNKSQLALFELKKMGFKDHGGGSIFQQTVSTTLSSAWTATFWYPVNLGTFLPAAHFRIDDLTDPQLCGVDVGGTDAYLS